jgi:hypothetical protein
MRYSSLIVILFSIGNTIYAQSVQLGLPFYDDAVRRSQLLGKTNLDVSYMIRPVNVRTALNTDNVFGNNNLLYPTDSSKYGKFTKYQSKNKKYSVELLPLWTQTRYNGHHPYGWNDGSMISAKGWQQFVSGGFHGRVRFVEFQFKPEFVTAQNKEFQNPPFRSIGIDFPERMGQNSYNRFFSGQSYIHVNILPVTIGYSTENIWWGGGLKNAIILSNNAPGFGHLTIHSNKPIKTPWGTIEGQMVAGRLKHSGFKYPSRYTPGEWPPIAGDVVEDPSAPKYHSFVNCMMGVYQPKWTPGLFVGVSRVVQASGSPKNLLDYGRVIYLSPKGENAGKIDSGGMNRNQLVSISFRYLFSEARAEIYGEIGREDWAWDFEDLMTRPMATTAYMIGFRKLHALPGKDRMIEVMSEFTKIQAPLDNYTRPEPNSPYSFYTTKGNNVGWTNQGQVLGAGIGPGSNMFTLGVKYYNKFNTTSIQYERVVYNEDLYYGPIDYLFLGGANPYFKDISKHFVDWGVILSNNQKLGNLNLGLNLHLLRTYNFQWNYDPKGVAGEFRFPGINVWSLNFEMSLVYRF